MITREELIIEAVQAHKEALSVKVNRLRKIEFRYLEADEDQLVDPVRWRSCLIKATNNARQAEAELALCTDTLFDIERKFSLEEMRKAKPCQP